jgi:hypothetical protein
MVTTAKARGRQFEDLKLFHKNGDFYNLKSESTAENQY